MKKVIPFSKTVHFKTMIAEVTDIEIKHTLKATDNQTIEGDILVDGTYKMTEASQIEESFHYTLPFTIEVDDKYDIQSADIGIHDFYFEIINEEDLKVNVELEISKVEEKILEDTEIGECKLVEAKIEDVKEEVEIETKETSKIDSEKELLEVREEEDLEIQAVDHSVGEGEFLEIEEAPKKVEFLEESAKENAKVLSSNIFQTAEDTKISASNTSITLENTPMTLEQNKKELIQTENKSSTSVSSIFSSISQEETFVTYYVYIVREQDTVESILEKYKSTREALAAYNDLAQIKAGSKIIIPCSNE